VTTATPVVAVICCPFAGLLLPGLVLAEVSE
jgi:hypothetical protein